MLEQVEVLKTKMKGWSVAEFGDLVIEITSDFMFPSGATWYVYNLKPFRDTYIPKVHLEINLHPVEVIMAPDGSYSRRDVEPAGEHIRLTCKKRGLILFVEGFALEERSLEAFDFIWSSIEKAYEEVRGESKTAVIIEGDIPDFKQAIEANEDPDLVASEEVNEPWMVVPDEGHDRTLAKLWYRGETGSYIAKALAISASQVYTIKTRLLKTHGEEVIHVRNRGAQKSTKERQQKKQMKSAI